MEFISVGNLIVFFTAILSSPAINDTEFIIKKVVLRAGNNEKSIYKLDHKQKLKIRKGLEKLVRDTTKVKVYFMQDKDLNSAEKRDLMLNVLSKVVIKLEEKVLADIAKDKLQDKNILAYFKESLNEIYKNNLF